MSSDELTILFGNGPPGDWNPQIGEDVCVYIGKSPSGYVFDYGTIKQRNEEAHYSGNTMVSYRVEFPNREWLQLSKNSMRPMWEVAIRDG
jgi:hypothetical protein